MSVVDLSEDIVKMVARSAGRKAMELLPLVCSHCDLKGTARVEYRYDVARRVIQLRIELFCGSCGASLLPDRASGDGSIMMSHDF